MSSENVVVSDASQQEQAFWLCVQFRVSSTRPTVLDGRDVPGYVRELEDVIAPVEIVEVLQ